MSFGILASNPCLGSPCIAGITLDTTTQTAGAIVMIVIVLALAWYGNKKWRSGSETTATKAPA